MVWRARAISTQAFLLHCQTFEWFGWRRDHEQLTDRMKKVREEITTIKLNLTDDPSFDLVGCTRAESENEHKPIPSRKNQQ